MNTPFKLAYFHLYFPGEKAVKNTFKKNSEKKSPYFLPVSAQNPCSPEWLVFCSRIDEIIREEIYIQASNFLGNLQIPLLIGLANMSNFSDFNLYNNLDRLPGREISGGDSRKKNYPAAPLITFGLDNVMLDPTQLDEDAINLDSDYYLFSNRMSLDKRYKFFDGSIWHRYVALVEGWENSFRELLLEIVNNYKNGVYSSVVAHEYLELQVRLLKNNFFDKVEDKQNNDLGHRKRVVPFAYWSETAMKKWGDNLWNQIQNIQAGIQWNCYLVDDYTFKQLRPVSSNIIRYPFGGNLTKGALIRYLANKPPEGKEKQELLEIANLADNRNRWTVEHLKEDIINDDKIYDVIFLDFHLGEIKPEDGTKTVEYGYSLLERIIESSDLIKKANPFGKYWIFPISAFPFAFKTNVNARGDENFTQYWNLSDGGNPICTPEHFRMKLYKLLFAQLEQSYLDIKELVNMLRRIYYFQDPIKVRQKARENYNYFTALLANFYRIAEVKNTQREGFMVWRTIDKDILLLTHLEQFIRLTAFGIESASVKKQEKLGLVKRIVRESHPDEDLIDTLNNISID